MCSYSFHYIFILLVISKSYHSVTSPVRPFQNYTYSIELEIHVAYLWWTVNETQQDILFELHINTTGWIAFGISPGGGMKGADIGLGWVDTNGLLHFQDRYAYDYVEPVVDNTTTDWFGLQGREQDGWTAIQFRRALYTCDVMDVPIQTGTDILIYAYGVEDPDMSKPEGTIHYHENRRGSRILPLRSYNNPSSEEHFADLDYLDFRFDNFLIPAQETTYHCKIFKVPNDLTERRHAIAHKIFLDSANRAIVHHMLLFECNPTAVFDDNNLPEDVCEDGPSRFPQCATNIIIGWGVGGDDIVEYPKVAGYPMGGDFEIKYYMIQMHYHNPTLIGNHSDSSGLRFYLGKERRAQEIGYLTVGAWHNPYALAIPPKTDRFIVDSYCTANTSNLFPATGISIYGAFPHAHMQGINVWTKLIRNKTAVDYVFNAETYDFNYQFENILPKPVQIYPGDELATRCVYSTTNKNDITLGGPGSHQEMCLHFLAYYPRISNLYSCIISIPPAAWMNAMNASASTFNDTVFENWLMSLQWTPELISKWQEFYNNAPRLIFYGAGPNFTQELLPSLPKYQDVKPSECSEDLSSSAIHQYSYTLSTFVSFVLLFAFFVTK